MHRTLSNECLLEKRHYLHRCNMQIYCIHDLDLITLGVLNIIYLKTKMFNIKHQKKRILILRQNN